MITSAPSSLDSVTLARRLADLAGDERSLQVDFLLHLGEFDRPPARPPRDCRPGSCG